MSRTVLVGFLVSLAAAAGCSSNTPSSPTASVAAPHLLTPPNLAQIANNTQPVTLVVQNAIVTQPGGTTYAFEVATDAAFTNKVQTKAGVAEGGGGQTGLTLAMLPAATTFYWHAQATAGGTQGVFSNAFQFTIGAAITISPPTPVSPANGASTTTLPTFIVNNSSRVGPVGVLSYRFDISTNATFATVTTSGTVPEGANQTSFTPASVLTLNTTYYWRVTAIDVTNVIASPPSVVQTFTASMQPITAAGIIAAQEGIVLWGGVQPPGTPGHAQMGSGWDVKNLIDFQGNPYVNPVPDALRVFDLLDRGMDPQSAINWMNSNGYFTSAAWYPGPQVVGFQPEYMALIGGSWNMVPRVGG
jgi:hypothetical protein